MLDSTISADQVRSSAGITFAEAQAACYFMSAAKSGWSLADLCEKTRMTQSQARNYAYRFGISFTDYNPLASPKRLNWHKVKGGWELRNKDDVIGRCTLTKDRVQFGNQYEADACGHFARRWNARAAMADILEALDGASCELFGGKPVAGHLVNTDGRRETLFPRDDEKLNACRSALAAA